ncbi:MULTISPECIES: GerAB/ArcD/ProY family transporter [Paenibacillus]|uniref:GerAB/ArcD/ProY family transporter n=1 Tax=Paenibacillus violae TaxID=3077234 RepID=A0ABU3RA30_9BACL|nr:MULTISPECIES: GerAB/ArcD/ProY family transporter [Paenibacillus]MDU0201133.1 GerAB/ArcD/ProY family transporter [Paenibacillus sp. PFR10]MEC0264990.1 GerAB/ArcD/ProY family transporter [Paenibacillus anseongense]
MSSRWISMLTVPFFFIGSHCSIIFLLFPRAMLHTTKYGHWEPAIMYMLIELILMVILLKGLNKAGNLDYADLLLPLGRWVSTALLLPLILYILMIGVMGIRGFAELMIIVFVVRSPLISILILLSSITLLGASIGPQGILRASTLLSFLHFPALLFALLGCSVNARLTNIFPLVNTSFDFMQHFEFLVPLFTICPFLLLGMLPPVIKVQLKPLLITMIPLTVLYVVIIYIPMLVFGVNAATLMNFPLVTSIDTVNLTWSIFNRISLFYAVALLAFVLVITSYALWASSVLVRKMIPGWKETYIRPVLCLLVFVASAMIPNWSSYVKIYASDIGFRIFVFLAIPIAVYLRGGFIQRAFRKKVFKNDA